MSILLCWNDAWCIYRPKLKEQMQYCVDHPEEISKLSKVKAQVSEVKGVMMENIEKVSVVGTLITCALPVNWEILKIGKGVYGLDMMNLVLQVLDRGEKIELLVDKTENLRSQVCDCNSLLFLVIHWITFFHEVSLLNIISCQVLYFWLYLWLPLALIFSFRLFGT